MKTIVLEIPGLVGVKDISIHIVGSTIGWGEGLTYPELDEEGRTSLAVGPTEVGVDFKHYVKSAVADRGKVREALIKAGYKVTGTGDDPGGGMWRMWFFHPDYPTFGDGVYANNTWE